MSDSSSPNLQWYPAPEVLALSSNEVHVWRAELNLPELHLKNLWQVLSSDERQRAKRFFFQKDRDKFIVARGRLRMILSRYLRVEPGKLHFCYGPHGKPALCSDLAKERLCFNVSHADGLALYAVAVNQELGVDLERVRADLDYEAIAQRFFSPQETTALLDFPPNCRREVFFRAWTCKEAYLKARGEGLGELNQVEVSLAPAEVPTLLKVDGDPQAAANWSLLTLNPGLDYVGTLAIPGQGYRIKCWQWQGQ